jgi:hypothetical protein
LVPTTKKLIANDKDFIQSHLLPPLNSSPKHSHRISTYLSTQFVQRLAGECPNTFKVKMRPIDQGTTPRNNSPKMGKEKGEQIKKKEKTIWNENAATMFWLINIIRDILVSLTFWILDVIGSVFVALKWPISMLVVILLLYSSFGDFISQVCTSGGPAFSTLLPFCPTTPTIPWESRPEDMQQAIRNMYQTKLEAMQSTNAENSELHKLMLSSELKLRDLTTLISLTDSPETWATFVSFDRRTTG